MVSLIFRFLWHLNTLYIHIIYIFENTIKIQSKIWRIVSFWLIQFVNCNYLFKRCSIYMHNLPGESSLSVLNTSGAHLETQELLKCCTCFFRNLGLLSEHIIQLSPVYHLTTTSLPSVLEQLQCLDVFHVLFWRYSIVFCCKSHLNWCITVPLQQAFKWPNNPKERTVSVLRNMNWLSDYLCAQYDLKSMVVLLHNDKEKENIECNKEDFN